MESCLYEGVVRHTRRRPVEHGFEYPLFMLYLDLSEVETVFRGRWLWSTRRRAPMRWRREDHLGDPATPLDEAVRSLVQRRLGERPDGPIRLLTLPRALGYSFNPVSFFYCFDAAGEHVRFVVAEVSNTPWNERHCYVLQPDRRGAALLDRSDKVFHVSPFMGMEMDYLWSLREPGEQLAVAIRNRETGIGEKPLFDAQLVMQRREISGASLARMLVRYPWITARVIAAIYGQAYRLRRKGVPVVPHPRERGAAEAAPR